MLHNHSEAALRGFGLSQMPPLGDIVPELLARKRSTDLSLAKAALLNVGSASSNV